MATQNAKAKGTKQTGKRNTRPVKEQRKQENEKAIASLKELGIRLSPDQRRFLWILENKLVLAEKTYREPKPEEEVFDRLLRLNTGKYLKGMEVYRRSRGKQGVALARESKRDESAPF